MPTTGTEYDFLLEPARLVELFRLHPPQGFAPGLSREGMPYFRTQFDLLTTFEKNTLRRLRALPLYRFWSRLLRHSACFAGTTVTEYAPVPRGASPAALLDGLLDAGRQDRLLIIKDVPEASPLLPQEQNRRAENLMREAVQRGFMALEGQALAYVPVDFAGVDAYLGRLSAARRKDLRRKMKQRRFLDIEVLPLGDSRLCEQGMRDALYAGYLAVFAQSDIHFDLLSREFFSALLHSDMPGVVICYRREGELIGHNICLVHEGCLIDKYIGFAYPQALEANLYFISWLYNLEFALEQGLHTYIAGWTDPEVKASLGARFTFTKHLVWVGNPVLRGSLRPFRRFFEGDRQALEAV